MGSAPTLPTSEKFMFDKMIFLATLSRSQVCKAVKDLHLIPCTKGDKSYWSSSSYAKIDGRHATIDNAGHLKLSCSIHKLYEQAITGRLDNSGECRMSDALSIICALFDGAGGLDIPLEKVKVRYMEIGLSFVMAHEPLDYIRQMVSVGEDKEREMFIDYHYERDRMKITAKTKNVRKCLKVYDKTFEAADKDRTVADNTLRVETQYRRMDMRLDELLEPETLNKFLFQFYQDWSSVTWVRDVTAAKGVKASQLAKAAEIMTIGEDAYLERHRREWKAGALSDKAWRTYREFAANWCEMRSMFSSERGPLEAEYDNKFQMNYVYARE